MTAHQLLSSAPLLLNDAQVDHAVDAIHAVRWMKEATIAAEGAALSAPARAYTDLDDGRLVFTTGRLHDEWFGYRSYDTFSTERGEQVVVVHAAHSGRVRGIAVGNVLGQIRTGALGGVAGDLLAREDAETVGVVGTGAQAWRQLWALKAVRDISSVRVTSRTPSHAEAFALRVRDELGIETTTCATAEQAVREQDIVVLATNSDTPVIDVGWLSTGTHVTTVGPKQPTRSEFPLELVEAADLVCTDSLPQLHAYDPPSIVATSEQADRVQSLGSIAAGAAPGRRRASDLTVYLSVGLAGSEVYLLHQVLRSLHPVTEA